MSTILSNEWPTLATLARRMDSKGAIANIAEVLEKMNPMVEDMPFMEGNLPTGHKSVQRITLPAGQYRAYNEGVNAEKSETEDITDNCAMMESYAEVDMALADLSGNAKSFRYTEDLAFMEGMSNTFSDNMIYANYAASPKKFNGFTVRYNSISTDQENRDFNVIDGGGSGSDNTSIWLVNWSPQYCFGIFPKGSKAGMQMKDLGQKTKVMDDGSQMEIYRSHYKWDHGLVIRDWRYVVRIANIDYSDLAGGSAANLVNLLIDAQERIPTTGLSRPVLYCNRQILSYLRKQIIAKSNVNLTFENVAGKRVTMFDGIPIRRCDSIMNTESTVS